MKYKLLFICFIAINFGIGCKAPDIVTPKSRMLRMMAALREGQTIQWDETVIDTVTPLTSIADSSSDFRNLYINRQTKSYHVVVSIPDSTVKQFQVARSVTSYSQRDTIGGQKIGKVVTYGSQFSTYDTSGSLIATTTMSGGPGDSAQDFADLPFFEYRPDTVVTDSQRTVFADTMTSQGYTVTNLGSSGFKVQGTFTESGTSWSVTSYFDHDYLTLTHMDATGGGVTTGEDYSYSSVGGYKINTTRVTTSTETMPAGMQGQFNNLSPVFSLSTAYVTTSVKTLLISNISLP